MDGTTSAGTGSGPGISSVSYRDHDHYFELLGEEERDAQSITRCWTANHRDVRLSACEPNFFTC